MTAEQHDGDRLPVPSCPNHIDSSFLTAVLRTAFPEVRFTVVTVDAISLNAGSYNAQLARLHLKYDREQAEVPRSLIAKLPTVQADLHGRAAVFRPGQRECWFYRHAAMRTPVNLPVCYYSAVDSKTGESFLLLEDLAPARPGDWTRGASIQEAQLALEWPNCTWPGGTQRRVQTSHLPL